METLIEMMRKVLADTFAMYLKAHNYHWNVEGSNFPQYHDFFGNLYQELHGAVDPIAEEIRALDAYVPGSLSRFLELTLSLLFSFCSSVTGLFNLYCLTHSIQ